MLLDWTDALPLLCSFPCVLLSVRLYRSADSNLVAIEAVVIGILTLTHFTGLIYKKLYLDVLEASFILNLGILAAATYSARLAETPESQAVVT